MELSRFLVNGDPELHLANFLHMITSMNESGSTEKQIESFLLNSQKVPKLSDEEPVWSIQSMGVMPLNTVTSATKGVPKRTVRPSSSSQSNRSRNPPKSVSSRANKSKMQYAIKRVDLNVPTTDDAESRNASIRLNHEGHGGTNTVDSVHAKHGLVDQDGFLGHGGTNAVDTIILEHGLVDQDGSFGFSQKDQLSHGTVDMKHASLTGRRGEELAFNYYRNKGIKVVKWVNEGSETRLPYDIEVCEDENPKEYIEVKTTDSRTKDWFEISVREWQFAVEKGESFSIARVV
ncbi:hypothetical protein HanXRQr2_Chr02g0085681 [Helianthus annuus]|uniref:Protein NO VEIN C-terminal domain-containing protein n=1 Tax=Helianthus annuus TaxID=4232 RepID=A0A251VJ86_HELAN|nr:hypothetical protein HanXRQr2_Chr02g0085681 [Helianthus annuus]KAJ0606212.1 hypothetical protein HanHA300_Chr02g0071531 [Helianthus annuus]KAJ0606213.1 hypothetical protein HanHA300_Chr02g0071541 [Helianthus annuus]KAJ0617216.1 hypothetical protein HanIR_Chr02g0099001 [Helianthus annuus]KAJ0617217.1 hypothetical protein HanIR_Chr02g0099011 [Helianthus annuus]